MKIAYYPGCSLHATARECDESLKAIAPALDLQLEEIPDWSCCGASSAHATQHLLGVALPARNLALAEAAGHTAVMAPCAACYSRLAAARHAAQSDTHLAARLPELLGRPFANTVEVRNAVQVLKGLIPAIQAGVKRPMQGLKVACYYGCLLVRPGEVTGHADTEQPSGMEEVVTACGGTPVNWNMRLECCGAGMSLSRTGSVVRLGRAILEDARKAGADLMVVACPMCHSNLDFRQKAMQARGLDGSLPVLYLTQLVGLALGLEGADLGLPRHFTATQPVLARLADIRVTVEKEAAEKAAKAAARAAAPRPAPKVEPKPVEADEPPPIPLAAG
jgi:heterodisulfide reductase subunit B